MLGDGLKAFASFGARVYLRAKEFQYSRIGPDNIFDIRVDDMAFTMSFADYKLQGAIVERIEGRREPQTTAVIKTLLRPGDHVLELGGCYGYFTMIMAHCVGETGRVVSLEGTPRNFDILRRNIELNEAGQVTPYNVFIASGASAALFDPEDTHPYAAIDRLKGGDGKAEEGSYQTVPTVILSQFLEEIGFTPQYIFMDIEGFEVDVFDDFSNGYLKKNRPTILFESHEAFYTSPKDLAFIMGILRNEGYWWREIGGNVLCLPE